MKDKKEDVEFIKEKNESELDREKRKKFEFGQKILDLETELVKAKAKANLNATNIWETFATEDEIIDSIDRRVTVLKELTNESISSEIIEKISENGKKTALELRSDTLEIITKIQELMNTDYDWKSVEDIDDYTAGTKEILARISETVAEVEKTEERIFGFLLDDNSTKNQYPSFVKGFSRGPKVNLEVTNERFNAIALKCKYFLCDALNLHLIKEDWQVSEEDTILFNNGKHLATWMYFQSEMEFLDECILEYDKRLAGEQNIEIDEIRLNKIEKEVDSILSYLEAYKLYLNLRDSYNSLGNPYNDVYLKTNFLGESTIEESIVNITKLTNYLNEIIDHIDLFYTLSENLQLNANEIVNDGINSKLQIRLAKIYFKNTKEGCLKILDHLNFLKNSYADWLYKGGEFVFSNIKLEEENKIHTEQITDIWKKLERVK